MSRIAQRFQTLQTRGRKGLIPYVTGGDPDPAATVPLLHTLVSAGADIIELGVPFSDPMADGPVIQRACERALARGTSLRGVLDMVRRFRQDDAETPVVLMGYLNPIEAMGREAFVEGAAGAGVDGVLVVDQPPEEARELGTGLLEAGIDPIFLLAPTTSADRVRRIAEVARGFAYYVSLKGVTGSSALDVGDLSRRLDSLRGLLGGLPVGVGFGIKDAATAAAVSRVADAVVVGSALVERIEALAAEPARMREEVAALMTSLRQAMDAAGGRNP